MFKNTLQTPARKLLPTTAEVSLQQDDFTPQDQCMTYNHGVTKAHGVLASSRCSTNTTVNFIAGVGSGRKRSKTMKNRRKRFLVGVKNTSKQPSRLSAQVAARPVTDILESRRFSIYIMRSISRGCSETTAALSSIRVCQEAAYSEAREARPR